MTQKQNKYKEMEKEFDSKVCEHCKKNEEHLKTDCNAEYFIWVKNFIRSLLASQKKEILDDSLEEAEKKADIYERGYKKGWTDCKLGRKKEPHGAEIGYCCACEYDIAGFEGEIKAFKNRISTMKKEEK